MILIMMNEWLGPQSNCAGPTSNFEPTERLVSFASDLPLTQALARIEQYRLAYRQRYPLAVCFRLLSVSSVDDMSDEQMHQFDASRVERLPTCKEEFE